jgi:hypothetical protein
LYVFVFFFLLYVFASLYGSLGRMI